MKRVFRPRLIALIAGVTALATLIPGALGAQEVPPPPNGPVADGSSSVLYLTRGSEDSLTWSTFKETITTKKNDCTAIAFTGDVLAKIKATGGGVLGDVKDGFGELGASDGTGEPCGRIDAPDQGVSLALSGELSNYAMTAIDVDLELKFGGIASIEFLYDGAPISFNSLDPAESNAQRFSPSKVIFDSQQPTGDDGPDSKDGDNYRVIARPLDCVDIGEPTESCTAVFFDEVVISAQAGAVSLEGGADFYPSPGGSAYGKLDPTNTSSQFEVQRVFDGTLNCGDSVSVGDGVDTPKGDFKRNAFVPTVDGEPQPCVLKVYDIDSAFDSTQSLENSITFAPTSSPAVTARYEAELTSVPYSATNENPVSQKIEYDPDGDGTYTTMLWCKQNPFDWITATATDVLPDGEAWCITDVTTVVLSTGKIQTIWSVIGEDDPGFKFG